MALWISSAPSTMLRVFAEGVRMEALLPSMRLRPWSNPGLRAALGGSQAQSGSPVPALGTLQQAWAHVRCMLRM